MFTSLTREGWVGLLAGLLTFLGLILGQVLPPEAKELLPYILAAIEAIGMILIYIFGRKTAQAVAKLKKF